MESAPNRGDRRPTSPSRAEDDPRARSAPRRVNSGDLLVWDAARGREELGVVISSRTCSGHNYVDLSTVRFPFRCAYYEIRVKSVCQKSRVYSASFTAWAVAAGRDRQGPRGLGRPSVISSDLGLRENAATSDMECYDKQYQIHKGLQSCRHNGNPASKHPSWRSRSTAAPH